MSPDPRRDEADLAFWSARLAGGLGVQELFPAHQRTGHATLAVLDAVELAPELGAAIDRLGAQCGVRRPAVFLAAVQLLLRRYTGVPNMVLGIPVRAAHAANLVLLRQDLSGDPQVPDLLRRVAAELAQVLDHRALPYPELVRLLDRSAPLFQVCVVLDDLVDPAAAGALASGDLTVRVTTGAGRVRVALLGDPATDLAALARFLRADLVTALGEITADPHRAASTVLACPAMERPSGTDPLPDLPPDPDFTEFGEAELERSIPARFAEQVRRWPDAPAVRADDGELTYRELYRMATGIAAGIGAAGARTGCHVAVLLGHGVHTVAAIMGVLISGNAYVPMDPSYPIERLGYMLRHSRADLVLVEPRTRPLADTLTGALDGRPGPPVLDVTRTDPAHPADPADPAEVAGVADPAEQAGTTPDSVAYLLYTSGSTGRPKGVLQNHRNVLFQVRNHTNAHRIGRRDRISVLSSFSFDASVTDLFSALLNGAAAVLVDIRRHGLAHLAGRLADQGVTVYHSTPTVYRYLLGAIGESERLPAVRLVLLGGEELTQRDVRLYRRHFAEHCVFVNGYGTTEVSFACQDHTTMRSPAQGAVLPVGRPLAGIAVLLVGADGRPACLHGEIVVRSRHVSIGYWDNPQADRERFTEHDGVRCYRTGDLGRRLPDGRIVFAGRCDRQVKVRGYRVELGEIEAALADDPTVGQAAVLAGPEEIVAYVAPAPGRQVDPVLLRRELARRLPHFMVPATVVPLEALPLTPTGKVDARRLPAAPTRPVAATAATREPMQRLVAEAWCGVLGVPAIGPDENFFDAGGHSLLMATVAQRLESALGRPVPLHRMYQYPTVASLALFLRGQPGDPAGDGLDRVAERMARRRRLRGQHDGHQAG